MQNFTYYVLSIVAIAVYLIINYEQLSRKGEISERAARYRMFLLSILFYYLSDAAWGIFAGLKWMRAWYVDTIFFFLSLAYFVYAWSRFVIVYLHFDKIAQRFLYGCGCALLAVNVALLAANPFCDCVYYFDAQGTYVLGGMRDVLFALLIAYSALISAFIFLKSLRTSGPSRSRNMMIFVNSVTMTLAIALQVMWPLTPFTALGCLIGNCFLHIFVVKDEQTEKHMRELEYALEQAHAAEKSRSTFFSIVSHDIRTPLNAIVGYSELLQSDALSKEKRAEALNSIRTSGKTLLELVNDVLDLAKIDAGKMDIVLSPVVLTQLTGDVFASFKMAAKEKDLELIDKTASVPKLMLDEHRIRQILFNLIGNAVKFTPRGSVTVEATYEDAILRIDVIDTGCGIEQDMLERILDPFVQVVDPTHSNARVNGSGLGLSICDRLVQVMGGKLSVKSAPWEGSTFSVSIAHVAVAPANGAGAPETPAKGNLAPVNLPKHVLVVDDSRMNRLVLKAFLKKLGIDSVEFAIDGIMAQEKIRAAARSANAFDFVFTDFWMPNMNGFELIELLRAEAQFADLKVYAITADTECHNDVRAKLFSGILFKPVTYDLLEKTFSAC